MTAPLVLDSAGLDELAGQPSVAIRALLAEALRRDRDVLVPAAVCAELARGRDRTAAVESVLARRPGADAPAVTVVDLDLDAAKQVGAILHALGAGSEDLVDASVVAVCAMSGGGMVVTGDPDDIGRLAQAVPMVRIVTRSPN